MTPRLKFVRPEDHTPAVVLHYETSADARVRRQLHAEGVSDERSSELLRAFHRVGKIRAMLGIKPGEAE